MDKLLKDLINVAGISGSEAGVAEIMKRELKKTCENVKIDRFGNVIAKQGTGKKKIMIVAHMDEIGLAVRHISKEGFIYFVKIGGIDDRLLVGQQVIIKGKNKDVFGIIGTKAPHLQKQEEKQKVISYEQMFIDIGAKNKKDAEKFIEIGDQIIFKSDTGEFDSGLIYGKALDDRLGCYALIKIMEKLDIKKSDVSVYAVASCQEEVGLKGARTSSFSIDPDFALVIDTTVAGDTPGITELDCALKTGEGVVITAIEASGRGLIVQKQVRDMFVEVAKQNKIKYQMSIFDGGMTDGAMINLTKSGIPTGVLSVACRYIHSPVSVCSSEDLKALINLAIKIIEKGF